MDIRSKTVNLIMRRYAVPKAVAVAMFDDNLLTEHQSKKVLIRDEYLNSGEKLQLTQLKQELADKYFVSVSTVEKYVHGV